MSDSVLVHYEVRGKVALLTLDDPPANTYTHEMMRQLDEGIIRARFDGDVEVIVITGAGEKFFCAGANIGLGGGADAHSVAVVQHGRSNCDNNRWAHRVAEEC